MRFFVPLSNDADHGERMYGAVRNRLKDTKEAVMERRIYVLKFEEGGRRRTVAVGDELHRVSCREMPRLATGADASDAVSDGPVMAILQGGDTFTYYVCTPKHGAFEGEPYTVARDAASEVEEFSSLR